MRGIRPAKLITIVLTLLLVVFLLPNFQFEFAGYLFQWQGVDLSLLGVNSSLANFQQGEGLYPYRQIRYEVSSISDSVDPTDPDLLARDLNLIQTRMSLSGLSDIHLSLEDNGAIKTLVFTFPNNYSETNAQITSSLLVSPGIIQIWQDAGDGEADPNITSYLLQQVAPDYKAIQSVITTADIESVSVETRSNLQSGSGNALQTPVWRLHFRAEVLDQLNELFNTLLNTQPVYLAVDGEPTFILIAIPVIDSNGQRAAYTGGEVLAVPLLTDSISQLRTQSTYLTAGSGFTSTFAYSGTFAEHNIYATNGQSRVALAIALSFPVLILLVGWQLGKKQGIEFGMMLGHFLAVSLALLKFGGTSISLGLMLALAVSYALTVALLYQLVQLEGKELISRRKLYRNFAIFIFLVCWVLFNLGVLSGLAHEFIGLVGIISVGLIISTLWGFRFLQEN